MEALRQIPPVNDILGSPELAQFQKVLMAPFALRLLDELMIETRQQLTSGGVVIPRAELTSRIAGTLASRLSDLLRPSMRRVINASGVVLHTNLGRAPLPITAVEHLMDVLTGYSNLEFDIEEGSRGKRDVHVERLIRALLDCESAIVVNNNAAAVLLVLNTLGEGGEVVASRGEQVEIGGSFRIPEVMSKSGAILKEVGTTNRTRIKDYEAAIGPNTRLLLRVHPSNFKMIGFTARPSLQEFVELSRRKGIPAFEDLGSGCLFDPKEVGIDDEPVVSESIRAGVDIVCFSGDKLLGGPQAGIIAGRKEAIDKVRQNPLFRALRVDKLKIAVLESVILSYLKGAVDEIPVWRMLHATEEELKIRAVAFAARLGSVAEAVPLASLVGGGSAPEAHLPSWGVTLKIPGLSDSQLENRLRKGNPPIIVRIEQGKLIVDLRTVLPAEESQICAALAAI